MRTDVEKAPLKEKIEAVFNPSNIDDDCDKIAGLLAPNKVQIGELLDKGSIMRLSRSSMKSLKVCRIILLRMSVIATLMICIVLTIPVETCLMLSLRR